VKKGLVFGIVTIGIIDLSVAVYILNSFLSDYLREDKKFFTIAFIVIVTFTFDYVNSKAKEFVINNFTGKDTTTENHCSDFLRSFLI